MTQEALKLALEALENGDVPTSENVGKNLDAITAIKQALAQTQEPVPPPWWPAVENILTEYGLQAIDFVADFKQALAQTQEPHGWYIDGYGAVIGTAEPKSVRVGEWLPWYTATPQRTWVGLTDEEVKDIVWNLPYEPSQEHIRAIEARLKELNT
jgi:hypothetical protein